MHSKTFEHSLVLYSLNIVDSQTDEQVHDEDGEQGEEYGEGNVRDWLQENKDPIVYRFLCEEINAVYYIVYQQCHQFGVERPNCGNLGPPKLLQYFWI